MKLLLRMILLIALSISNQVMAAPISTPLPAWFLLAACKESETNEYARGFCGGAIDALYSSIQEWCVPGSITHGEIKAHIKNELLKTDPPFSKTAFEFINRSVQEAWPCH